DRLAPHGGGEQRDGGEAGGHSVPRTTSPPPSGDAHGAQRAEVGGGASSSPSNDRATRTPPVTIAARPRPMATLLTHALVSASSMSASPSSVQRRPGQRPALSSAVLASASVIAP